LLGFWFLVCSVPGALAQHATAFDVVDGKQAFSLYCANCHGPDGDLIANVDLGHGNFRQPYTDTQLAAIIRNGIANTPMPASPNVSDEQADKIVAYLRSLAVEQTPGLTGNALQGRVSFEGRGECLDCHRVNGRGSRLGPDLSHIGVQRSVAELEVSLRAPERQVQANHRFYAVTTKAGERISGRLLNQDTFTVQLLDTNERLRSFLKTDLLDYSFADPRMPALGPGYSDQEIADLVEYLASLRGLQP
jgi:putative heme-binding domain-containing protein